MEENYIKGRKKTEKDNRDQKRRWAHNAFVALESGFSLAMQAALSD